jgi:flagellar basal-body rod protein FlgB
MPQDDPRLLYRIPNQPSMDGNTVDADIELTEFTKNSVLTEFAINRFGSTIKSRMSAITGQPS